MMAEPRPKFRVKLLGLNPYDMRSSLPSVQPRFCGTKPAPLLELHIPTRIGSPEALNAALM